MCASPGLSVVLVPSLASPHPGVSPVAGASPGKKKTTTTSVEETRLREVVQNFSLVKLPELISLLTKFHDQKGRGRGIRELCKTVLLHHGFSKYFTGFPLHLQAGFPPPPSEILLLA